ncbi:MAG: alpha/beta hydrolase [Microbacterium arborescens]
MLLAGGIVVGVVAASLVTTTTIDVVASRVEAGRLEDYGQAVEVDGRRMNVLIEGTGDETIVLLPGFGTSSPVLDFAPLTRRLAVDHRVVVVEPFGYGLSDPTDRERTSANIVGEIHDALDTLGIDRYVLMGHSIAGIHALELTARYPDEVEAFVGIDTSVPEQPGMDAAFPIDLLRAAKTLGLSRIATAFGGASGAAFTDRERDQIDILTNRNSLADTYLDEMSRIGATFADAEGRRFPAYLPLLLFVVAENPRNPEWAALHENQAATVADGTVIPLAGDHYLHHTQAAAIADAYEAWSAARVGD